MLAFPVYWSIDLAVWVLLFPVMGFIAGVLGVPKPRVAGLLMLISGLGGGFIGFLFWLGTTIFYLRPVLLGVFFCFEEVP